MRAQQQGYHQWTRTYDDPRNSLFDVNEPIVHEIPRRVTCRTALDAACGGVGMRRTW